MSESMVKKQDNVKKNRNLKLNSPDMENCISENSNFNSAEEVCLAHIHPWKVEKSINALFSYLGEHKMLVKNQILNDFKYILDITSYEVANCPKRIVKLRLQHSLITEDYHVCFIVKDKKRGSSQEDTSVQKNEFEKHLRECGLDRISVLPFAQLKKEYGNHEMKNKLSNSFDAFLCDGTIIGHVVGFLGKKFQNTRYVPIPVRMNTKSIAQEIKRALMKTAYKQGQKGSMISIVVGTDKMAKHHVADNIMSIIAQLKHVYPGGYENIRNIFVKINIKGTKSLPLYVNICPPFFETVNVESNKAKKLKRVATELKTSKFRLTNNGTLLEINNKK